MESTNLCFCDHTVSKVIMISSLTTPKISNTRILDKEYLRGCGEGNAYIFRDAQRNGKWCIYFIEKKIQKRHRIVLKDEFDNYPTPSLEGRDLAYDLGIKTFFALMNKVHRGERINTLSIKRMCELFLKQEQGRIRKVSGRGTITKETWEKEKDSINHYQNYLRDKEYGLGRALHSAVHLMPINHLDNYLNYRQQTTNKTDNKGELLPRRATCKTEISHIRRMYQIIGVDKRYITPNQKPYLSDAHKIIITKSETQDTRRSSFDEKEYADFERNGRSYYIKGLSRFHPKTGELFGFEKYKRGDKKGKDNLSKPIRKNVIFGNGKSERAINQMKHRNMVFFAYKLNMETGIRCGALAKLKWKDIHKITKSSKRDDKVYRLIKVRSETNKTRHFYDVVAPVAYFLSKIRNETKWRKKDDYIFANQKSGNMWSERIWVEGLYDLLIESDLADRNQEAVNKAVILKNGKKISRYSFRHTFITMRLRDGMPIGKVAKFCDTGVEYIQKHYDHYDPQHPKNIDDLELGRHSESFRQAEADDGWDY